MNNEIFQESEDDSCDLDPNKQCDNCGKCIDEQNEDYKVVRIDGIVKDEKLEIDWDDYMLEDETLKDDENDEMLDIVYIEDIPELKKEYDEKVDELLGRK